MRCSRCGRDTSAVDRCDACGASLSSAEPAAEALTRFRTDGSGNPLSDAPTIAPSGPEAPTVAPAAARDITVGGPLSPGQAFGPRYRITRLLGIGGMGAVYEAADAELGVTVAIKVIRPETTADPAAAEQVEQRFKRELLLAREVTHKNVVRIHDLGEIDRIKYITMTYVDGEDLASILKARGKLPVREALPLARQIAAGLEAAHEAGIVHRDLKPANVMVDQDGHALIMDFGIARLEGGGRATDVAAAGKRRTTPVPTTGANTTGGRAGGVRSAGAAVQSLPGATVAGAVVGTMDYMAPEQAQGLPVDHRADIYAFGLILRDVLTGVRRGRDPLSDLLLRIQKGLPPLRSIDPDIPESLERIAARCAEVDPGARYQQTSELCAELNRLDDDGVPLPEPRRVTWRVVAAAVVLVSAVTGGVVWLTRPTVSPPAHEPVSVLVADFENSTGDPVFSGVVEQALAVGLEGASFVSVYPKADARTLITQMTKDPAGKITPEAGQLLARREGVKVLVTGRFEGGPPGYRLRAQLTDPSNGKTLTSLERSIANKAAVLEGVARLAEDARVALGESKTGMGRAETFTASSLVAVREYTLAQELQAEYRDEEAAEHYRRAVADDPDFGRAYAAWAYTALRLGHKDESAELWKKALSLIGQMTEREKYRTLGIYYGTITRDFDKAIENYATLVRLFPADEAGYNNLALSYFSVRNFDQALEQERKALRLYPRQALYRGNAALFAMYAGNFAWGAAEAGQLVKEKPTYYPAYLPLAIAALAEGRPDAARDFYAQMKKTGRSGASIATLGLADIALYEGRLAESGRLLEEGLAEDARNRNQTDMASKYVALAETRLAQGRRPDALRSIRQALAISHGEEVAYPAACVLTAAGATGEAEALAREAGGQLEPQRRAYGKLIEAETAFSRRQLAGSLEALRAGQKLADLWVGRLKLGRLYVEAGRYAEAVSELELSQKRRGEATSMFLDDRPTFRYLVELPYWLARAQEGLGMQAAAQANYKAFLGVRAAALQDPLVLDARRRLNQP
jgi:eukaryotic-like serine/threonine-protein kinase